MPTMPILPTGVPVRKRLFDLLLVLPGIMLISPILGWLALALLYQRRAPGDLPPAARRAAREDFLHL